MYPLDSSFTWFWHSTLKSEAESHPVKPWIVEIFIGMNDEIFIALCFFIKAVITLFLIPPYLLAVIELQRIVFKNTLKALMLVFLIFIVFATSVIFLFQQFRLVSVYYLSWSSPPLLQAQGLWRLDAIILYYIPQSCQVLEQVLPNKEAHCSIVHPSELNHHYSLSPQLG